MTDTREEYERLRGQVAEQDRRIEDLRVGLIRAINTALSRAGVELPTAAAATVESDAEANAASAKAWREGGSEIARLSFDSLCRALEQSRHDTADALARAQCAERAEALLRERAAFDVQAAKADANALLGEISDLTRERDELRDLRRQLAEAHGLTATETARADQNYADLKNARAAVKALEGWRDSVTVALQRPGRAHFSDVLRHVRDLVAERDDLERQLAKATEWRPMCEHIAEPTIVAWEGQGGRVGVYGACNFGPLPAHQHTDALGWLPIPPYRAKKEGQ
jgi:DNA repair exonuclease SbcCD ATPase subunit